MLPPGEEEKKAIGPNPGPAGTERADFIGLGEGMGSGLGFQEIEKDEIIPGGFKLSERIERGR